MPTAYDIQWPNLRACFLPDPGYALVEADLQRADAQVIAWEANATDLKHHLRTDHDIHSENADMLFAHAWRGSTLVRVREISPRTMHVNGMSYRDNAKRWVHGTNFGGGPRVLASTMSLSEDHVGTCQRWWLHERHPQLGQLHRHVERELNARKNPVFYNKFGFRRIYVGGPRSRTGNLIGQALAWIAQSTVANVINQAMLQIDARMPEFELLLQIHDSLLGQVPLPLDDLWLEELRRNMRVTVPYDDPLVIGCDIKWSATSWGAMRKNGSER